MLYQTLFQPYLLVVYLLAGFLGGLVFDFGNFIKFLFANKKIPSIVIDFIQTIICIFLLFFVNLSFNYGTFRLFVIILFLFAFSLERFSLGKIIAKFYLLCYTFINKILQKVAKKFNCDKTNKND